MPGCGELSVGFTKVTYLMFGGKKLHHWVSCVGYAKSEIKKWIQGMKINVED